jgi:hypothetical protein
MKSIISITALISVLSHSTVALSTPPDPLDESPVEDTITEDVNCFVVPTLRRPEARRDGILFKRDDAATIGLYFKYCTPRHLEQIRDLEELTLKLDKQVETSTTIVALKDGIIADKDREIELLEASRQPLWEQLLIYTGIAVAAAGLGVGIGVAVSN